MLSEKETTFEQFQERFNKMEHQLDAARQRVSTIHQKRANIPQYTRFIIRATIVLTLAWWLWSFHFPLYAPVWYAQTHA
jgi:hypothetical protein